MLGSGVDDMDLSFLSELLHQGEPVPEPASPPSSTSSKELVVSSPSGRSDATESSDDDVGASTPKKAKKQGPEPAVDPAGRKADDRKAKRRAQVAISARRHRSRKKVSRQCRR
jgi:hypothetical protein